MSNTPHLALPLLAAAQAQKHVTHNVALAALDALVHLAVKERGRTAPPPTPEAGDRYLVGAGGTGAFAKHAGEVAWFDLGLWRFVTPRAGWRAYVVAEDRIVVFDGAAWRDLGHYNRDLDNLAMLGVGTAPDPANPLSAKLNAALLAARAVAEGGTGDLRLVLNKELAARVVSQLFQTAYGGRAELGLIGDDDFTIKVSPDGASWTEALRIERASGFVSFPAGASAQGSLRNRIVNGGFTVNQRGYVSGGALAAGAFGHDRWKAGPGGCTYAFAAAAPDTTITIAAGTIQQVVEGANVEGGAYALSWTGTSQGRVGTGGASPSGAFAPSPIILTGVPAGQTVIVEFTAGGLGKVQLEPGAIASTFERRSIAIETVECERYYRVLRVGFMGDAASGAPYGTVVSFSPMRAAPTATWISSPVASSFAATAATYDHITPNSLRAFKLASATAGAGQWIDIVSLSAEL